MGYLGARTWGGFCATAILTGCAAVDNAASLQMRVSALQQEQAQREYELQQIRIQIDAESRQLDIRKCQVAEAKIDAEVAIEAASCLAKRSQFAQCEANNHAHAANSSVLGCLAGLGASVVTGGAAAPLFALGCGGGAVLGHASNAECGPDPTCTPDQAVVKQEVLRRQGLTAPPVCQ